MGFHKVVMLAGALALGAMPALAQQKGGVVNVATVGEPPTLDPMASTADLVGIITQHFFETLYTFDKNWKVTPLTLEYPTDTTRAIMNLIISNTATRSPDVRFIFSHAGGTLVSIAGRFLGDAVSAESLARPAEPNSRLAHVRRFYYDTAGSTNPVQMQSLRLLVPDSQIVFGTDYPLITPERWLADFEKIDIRDDVRPLILKRNAIELLKLGP